VLKLGVSHDVVLNHPILVPLSPDETRLLGLTSCLFASMTNNVANIAELQAQLAAEENRRRVAENKQRAAEDKQRAAEDSLDIVTRHTTLSEYLDLHQRLCATQLTFDPERPRNTRSGVTNPRD